MGVVAPCFEWPSPSRANFKQPTARGTLNQTVRLPERDVRDFVMRDFHRTASIHLHEARFNSDWMEQALAHEQ